MKIGTRVNQFEIRSILGEGGTAVVYEAVHTKLNAPVALKVVNMEGPHGPNAAARLRREAELCAAVDDAHVPKIYDVGTLPDGTPYLVMEKVVGPTLESLLSRGRLGLRLGMLILRDLLRAMEAVQRASVVHRDIKPANIIVQFAADRTPSVRLMDFGVSRSLFFRRGSSHALTRRGTILGTPEYMAPEQIQDHPIDVRTDVYALGVVAYEMFAGRVPFEGEHPAEIVAAVLRREHQPLCVHRPEAPSELVALIERAMESAPDRRFKNAHTMREELEASVPRALWAPAATTLLSAAAPAPRQRRSAPRDYANLTLGVSLMFALGSGVFALSRLPGAPQQPMRATPQAIEAPATPAPQHVSAGTAKPRTPSLLSAIQATALARAQSRQDASSELVARAAPHTAQAPKRALGAPQNANSGDLIAKQAAVEPPETASAEPREEMARESPFAPDLNLDGRPEHTGAREHELPPNPYE